MSAVNEQVGGSHYKNLAYQPAQLCAKIGLNGFQYDMLSYVTRYKNKNGQQDLEKIIHWTHLGEELTPKNFCSFSKETSQEVQNYISANMLSSVVGEIVCSIVLQDWDSIRLKTELLIDLEYASEKDAQ